MKIKLEFAPESHPGAVHSVGFVIAVPAVGDYVDCKDTGWYGYVRRTRWSFGAKVCVVRCWLYKDPPQR